MYMASDDEFNIMEFSFDTLETVAEQFQALVDNREFVLIITLCRETSVEAMDDFSRKLIHLPCYVVCCRGIGRDKFEYAIDMAQVMHEIETEIVNEEVILTVSTDESVEECLELSLSFLVSSITIPFTIVATQQVEALSSES